MKMEIRVLPFCGINALRSPSEKSYSAAAAEPDRDEPRFPFCVRVGTMDGENVLEDALGVSKRDAVLSEVRARFGGVELETHVGYSIYPVYMGQGRPRQREPNCLSVSIGACAAQNLTGSTRER